MRTSLVWHSAEPVAAPLAAADLPARSAGPAGSSGYRQAVGTLPVPNVIIELPVPAEPDRLPLTSINIGC